MPRFVLEIGTEELPPRFFPVVLPDSAALRVRRLYPGAIIKPAVRQLLVPAPTTGRVGGFAVQGPRVGGQALQGPAVLEWVRSVISAVTGG